MPDVDDDISFSASAFDVVGSWLLGGKAAASKERVRDEDVRAPTAQRAPVTLYRPSTTTTSLTRPGTNSANCKVLTEEEKEMKKKLLRKSGTYRHQQQQEDEKEVVDTEAMDKEEEALLRAKHGGRNVANQVSNKTDVRSAQVVAIEKAEGMTAAPASTASAVPTKKRKASAQEELLEKLRDEAARKKAKNLKTKQRLQRKKEEAKQQQQQHVQT